MKRFHRNIGARDAALEKTPEILQAIRMHAAIDVLSSVVNDLMRIVRRQSIVGHECIAIESRASGDVLVNLRLQFMLLATRHDFGANLSAALQDAHDGSLVLRASSRNSTLALTQVHIPRLAADEGFVNFHFAAALASEEIILHCEANPWQHEPCRLLGNSHVLSNLVATYAVLPVRKHPRWRKPFVQRNRAVLVDSPDLDGELALRVMTATLPSAPLSIEAGLLRTATGADHAIRPTPNSNVVN